MLIWVSGETSGVPAAGEIVSGALALAAVSCPARAAAAAMSGRTTNATARTANSNAVRRAGTAIRAGPDAPPSITTVITGTESNAATGTK
jgi:hypothetical protein